MHLRIFSFGLLAAALLAAPTLNPQQPATAPVVITVKDPSGSAIAQARIRIVPAPDGPPAKMETDAMGQVALALKPGGYTLFTSVAGFKNATRRFVVAPVETAGSPAQLVSVALQIGAVGSPVVYTKESLLLYSVDPESAPLVLSQSDFGALPHIAIKVHNGHNNSDETYSGVSLTTLLTRVNAPLGKELRGKALTTFVVVTGTDGYSVVLSLAEADPSFRVGQSPGQIIVADAREGQPLGKSGPYQLIVPGDAHPARWVHNLESIGLQTAH